MEKDWDTKSNEELCLEYQKTNSDELYNYFILKNKNLINYFYKHLIIEYPNEKEDILQLGKIAIWDAMLKYNSSKHTKFTTTAYYYFKKHETLWRFEKMKISCNLNYMNKLDKIKEKYPFIISEVDSLDKQIVIGNENNVPLSLINTITSDTPSPEEVALKLNDYEYINNIAKIVLKPREWKYIKDFVGINRDSPMNFQEIGDRDHLTRERARQIVNSGLEKLRYYFNVTKTKSIRNMLELKNYEGIKKLADNCLNEIEFDCLVLRYGLNGNDKHTLRAIANKYNITPESTRTKILKSIDKLEIYYYNQENKEVK